MHFKMSADTCTVVDLLRLASLQRAHHCFNAGLMSHSLAYVKYVEIWYLYAYLDISKIVADIVTKFYTHIYMVSAHNHSKIS